MFKINQVKEIRKEQIKNSFIYTIDNFYQDPEKILNYFLSTESRPHKENQKPSYNQIYFDDRRHRLNSEEIKPVYKFLSQICKQKPEDTNINTNLIRFNSSDFNDYKSNYWWPHRDSGYTGIVYLNKDEEYGTNLYENISGKEEPPRNCPEHFEPWRKKSNFKLIKSMKPKFNRMILFDGCYFIHGMNICGDRYFGDEYRMNQVFFFKPNHIVYEYS